jgi:hypothetical protein
LYISIEKSKRIRTCHWCRAIIAPGELCLAATDRIRNQMCVNCVRKAHLIMTGQTNYTFEFSTPPKKFLDTL